MSIIKYYLDIQKPSLNDNTADIDRVQKYLSKDHGLERVNVAVEHIGRLSRQLRISQWQVTAVVTDDSSPKRLIALETGDTSGQPYTDQIPPPEDILSLPDLDRESYTLPNGTKAYGLALDLGTTSLVMELMDLADGRSLAQTTLTNPQTKIGTDILTRIHYAKGDGLAQLQRHAVTGIQTGVNSMCAQTGIDPTSIAAMAVGGNTTMTHLFLGLDPFTICREPYIPLINQPDPCSAARLGLQLHPQAVVYTLPNIGSYFGGDLIAGLIWSGLADSDDISLLVDVGTNAEVVIGNRDWLMACAGAAGPALEGGVAKMGMAAGPGAIERVRIDPQTLIPEIGLIGDTTPVGICGSGLIDLVAELYLAGVIDMQARIILYDHPRIILTESGPAYVLVADNGGNGSIFFSQLDLDVLLRSKAAMYTILTTLVSQVGLRFDDLTQIYVAGTFGRHIDPRQAIVIGMIPDVSLDHYQTLGNACLKGTRQSLLLQSARQKATQIREQITYLELNVNQEFMNRFSAAKFMPHTDAAEFPSVAKPFPRPEHRLD